MTLLFSVTNPSIKMFFPVGLNRYIYVETLTNKLPQPSMKYEEYRA